MTKSKKESSVQTNIFEWLKKAEELTRQTNDKHPAGSLYIDREFKSALSEDLKNATDEKNRELSRAGVADKMTELLGEEITTDMLNNWTAQSHPHNLPCVDLPAFVLATGGQRRAFEVLSRRSGLFALPGREALRAEIQRIDEDIKKKKAEKHKRIIFLKEIEGGER